jgi:hypothetical protein
MLVTSGGLSSFVKVIDPLEKVSFDCSISECCLHELMWLSLCLSDLFTVISVHTFTPPV